MAGSDQTLNELIEQWCERHLSSGCAGVSDERIDELRDHLMCVAEAQMEQGASAAEAVEYAVEQFGDPSEVKTHLADGAPAFRRWLAHVHCKRAPAEAASGRKVVLTSFVIAAALLVSAWIIEDQRTFAFLSTVLIAVWVVLTARMGGTREAARAEWRWLKSKLGF